MHIRYLLPIVPLALAALTPACSDDDDGSGGAGGTGTTTTGTPTGTPTGTSTGTGGGTGGGNPTCTQSIGEGGSTCSATWTVVPPVEEVVNTVTADIVDLQGSPAANIPADVCGLNLCEFASADANGHVSVDASGATFQDVRLLYGNGLEWVKFAAPLPSVPDADFGTITAVALPPMASGVAFSVGGTATSGDVTLDLAPDVFVEFNILFYCFPEDQVFRAATIPLGGNAVLPAIPDNQGFEMAFGLAPIDTKFCRPAQMTVPNTPGWSANAPVEFWFHGTSVFQDHAPFGGWAKVSDGAVSGDGQTVSTNPGEGIPQLGVIAIRLQ
jgi:hypothetical protein